MLSYCYNYLIFKVCTFNIIYCLLKFGHNDYKDPMTVLDSDDELVLLNGDPTDFYLFEVLCDIMDCTGTYFVWYHGLYRYIFCVISWIIQVHILCDIMDCTGTYFVWYHGLYRYIFWFMVMYQCSISFLFWRIECNHLQFYWRVKSITRTFCIKRG
jgi:hypothetical protein